ncbi:FAD-NAD(P)-binding protein [Skeletonema marinoi]|uniref:FAD-NAD(P)-binding protein n=2 Tax=Skeletonema marinoi TaxID=267567 RepID=A0AAD8Y0L1_9STRA|nr:FAD-NAD(P)-binding protein [Skeletonema marinoi]
MIKSNKKRCDVCIIGAGPAALATLSAIHEPYTLDSMTPTQVNSASESIRYSRGVGPSTKKVCVVDPSGEWLGRWNDNFDRLGIEYLRSPALAHPDHFDINSLLAYAVANDREDELVESGCAQIRKLFGLGQTQVGLWKLPSTRLFRDFCIHLARQLKHDFVKGMAVDLTRNDNGEEDNDDTTDTSYTVTLADGSEITCKSVVLALGPTGTPVTPTKLCHVPKERLIQWPRMKEHLKSHHKRVLVVGGGLTAVQVAQYCLRSGRKVVLCSRRPLVERHFDIDTCWFDRRSANLQISEFYHQSEAERLTALKEVRGGGSVPPIYMNDVRKWQASGELSVLDGVEPEYMESTADGRVVVAMGKDEMTFDFIILACGIKPDFAANQLVKSYQEKSPLKMVGGFPSVSVDLEWSKNLFVVGALASLNVGPDSGNIMGARRAASLVANALECKAWLRDADSRGALSNRFDQLFWDEEDSSSCSSDSDSDCD